MTGTPDLHSGAVGAGTVQDYETNLAISTSSWISCHGAVQEDRHLPADRHGSGADPGALPGGEQPRDRRRVPAVAARPGHRAGRRPARRRAAELRRASPLRRVGARRQRRHHLHPVALRRAVPGRRSQRRAAASTTSRCRTTRAHLVRAVLEGVAYNSRWLHDAVEELREAAPGPRPVHRWRRGSPISGARSTPTCWTGRSNASPTRSTPTCAAPRCSPGSRSGRCARTRCGAWSRSTRRSGRITRDRATYDRLYAEFPKLYKAQKPMFRRLNQPA